MGLGCGGEQRSSLVDAAQRAEIVRRLMAMQSSLRNVIDAAEMQGRICDAAGESGLAFAVYMLRESLAAYSKQLSVFVEDYVSKEFSDGIEED